jgi:biotin carboxylase
VFVLEEPSVLRANSDRYAVPPISQAREAAYTRSDEAIAIAKEWAASEPFDGVIAGREAAVTTAAAVAENLGLPGPGIGAANTCCDKLALRRTCAAAGLPQPDFVEADRSEGVARMLRRGSVVVKPTTSAGSVGVIRVDNPGDLEAAIAASLLEVSEVDSVAGREQDWPLIVEQYVPGPCASVETVVQHGRKVFENITQQDTIGDGRFVKRGHIVPAPVGAAMETALGELTSQLIAALGAETGIFHSEWTLAQDGPVLLECANRPPGDYLLELVELASGVNVAELVLASLCGGVSPDRGSFNQTAGIRFFTGPSGRLERVCGLELVRRRRDVERVVVDVEPGQEIMAPAHADTRLGHVIVVGKSASDVIQALDEIDGTLHFAVTP